MSYIFIFLPIPLSPKKFCFLLYFEVWSFVLSWEKNWRGVLSKNIWNHFLKTSQFCQWLWVGCLLVSFISISLWWRCVGWLTQLSPKLWPRYSCVTVRCTRVPQGPTISSICRGSGASSDGSDSLIGRLHWSTLFHPMFVMATRAGRRSGQRSSVTCSLALEKLTMPLSYWNRDNAVCVGVHAWVRDCLWSHHFILISNLVFLCLLFVLTRTCNRHFYSGYVWYVQ